MHLFRKKPHNHQQLGRNTVVMQNALKHFSGFPVWTLSVISLLGQDPGTVWAEPGLSCSHEQFLNGRGHRGWCGNASPWALALFALHDRANRHQWMVQVLHPPQLPCCDTSLCVLPSPWVCHAIISSGIYPSFTTCHTLLPVVYPRMTFLQGTRSNTRPRYQLGPTRWKDYVEHFHDIN